MDSYQYIIYYIASYCIALRCIVLQRTNEIKNSNKQLF